jgi:phage baseplate assembly protein W
MSSPPSPLRPRVGFPLLPVPDEHGALHFPSLEASVRQSIEVILRTRPGEQLMRPGFGAGLEDFIGRPNTLATRRHLQEVVTGALTRWEPRLEVERVEVLEVENAPAHVRVELVYRLRRTGLVQGLGLTLELGE